MYFNSIAVIILLLIVTQCHKMVHYTTDEVLDPKVLKPYMFKTSITGQMNIMLPYKQNMTKNGDINYEEY